MSNPQAPRKQNTDEEIVDEVLGRLQLHSRSDHQLIVEQRALSIERSKSNDAVHAEDFRVAKEEFRSFSSQVDPQSVIAAQIDTALSWDDVLLIATNAVDNYNKKARNGVSGFFRRFGRAFGEHAPTIRQGVKLVPKSGYTEPLLGIFDFIIDAAAMLREKSQQIEDSLAGLPDTLQIVAYARETYPADKDVTKKSRKLYTAVLTAVWGMIKYLEKNPGTKILKAMTRGEAFESTLARKLEMIKSYYNEIDNLAEALNRELGAQTNKIARRLERRVALNGHQLEYLIDENYDFHQKSQTAFDDLRHFLIDILRKKKWGGPHPVNPPLSKQSVTSADLQRLLNIDPTMSESEIQIILDSTRTEADPSNGLFCGIPQDKRFQNWLSTNESELLFVQDNMTALEPQRISSLSVFCAGLTRSLREDHAVIAIHFFCGRHDMPEGNNPISGPAGMIRSLIFQLIRTSGYVSFDLDFLTPAKVRNKLDKGDMPTLCWVFVELVRQLLLDTVLFCFVDGLSFFEGPPYRNQTLEAIQCLRGIVEDPELSSIFKLMITHSSSNGHRKYYINPGDCLLLSRQAEFEGYDLTEREIAARVRRARRDEKAPVLEVHDFSGSEDDEEGGWNGALLLD